jgi:hypothetical protein
LFLSTFAAICFIRLFILFEFSGTSPLDGRGPTEVKSRESIAKEGFFVKNIACNRQKVLFGVG